MTSGSQRRLVAGVDSSTQSCKVVVRDAETGVLVRRGKAAHPEGTEVHPDHWWTSLGQAIAAAGGLDDVAAIAVGGQQHGMVCLDDEGRVVRPALLWNDTRSAQAAHDLTAELGGPRAWADAIGSVPVASFTITKLRWLDEHEPESARRTAAVCLPHDWLTWRLSGSTDLADLVTDRSDASGTGYWSAATGDYRLDLLERALGVAAGAAPRLPRVLGPAEIAGRTPTGALLGPGAGDNAAAALGLGAGEGDAVVSLGTSGVVSAVSTTATADASGLVAGFADATGLSLPLVCTLNAARVLDFAAQLLDVDHAGLTDLALAATPGAGGLVLVPYLEGERTPDLPDATGSLHGVTLRSGTRQNLARAAIEGVLCGLADGIDAMAEVGVRPRRAVLVGGAAASEAVRQVAAQVLGIPVEVPEPGEYVADGACRQAAWVLSEAAAPPAWEIGAGASYAAAPEPSVRERYAAARTLHLDRLPDGP